MLRAPDDYVAVHSKFFDLIEKRDTDGACKLMGDYLDRHDQAVAKLLGGLA